MTLEPIAIADSPSAPLAVGGGAPSEPDFEVQLGVFSGPLAVLLHLIESRQLDVLSVPLAELADAYVAHLATNPIDPGQLAEFVTVAAQLILLKSRSLLPGELPPGLPEATDEPDEEELRRRLLEYRALRDVAHALGGRDLVGPLMRREPRESDLPSIAVAALPASVLAEALRALAAIPEPEASPPEIVAREITIAMQIAVLRVALAAGGRVVLQQLLATCRSRTEATVTLLATLELVRRRQVSVTQRELFGPIVLETMR
ncbi:MAG: segregation/condensation protein A [Chloroflexota bacterium]|nr:segregation/condensation protein A [Chloroflexota bacterium]